MGISGRNDDGSIQVTIVHHEDKYAHGKKLVNNIQDNLIKEYNILNPNEDLVIHTSTYRCQELWDMIGYCEQLKIILRKYDIIEHS